MSVLFCLSWFLLAAPAQADDNLDSVVTLLEIVLEADEQTAVECLDKLIQQAQSGELSQQQLQSLRGRLSPAFTPILQKDPDSALCSSTLVLATMWGDSTASKRLRDIAFDQRRAEALRSRAIEALAAVKSSELLKNCGELLASRQESTQLKGRLLGALGRYEQAEVADAVLHAYSQLVPELQSKVISLLIQRPTWSKRLLSTIDKGKIPANVLNVNHLRALLGSPDGELAAQAKRQFGSVRAERDPNRDHLIAEMREMLDHTAGDSRRGEAVFNRVCGQCHRIHGMGQDVGPDITSNGRASFDQLLSNVFDPSLVIGPGYQAVTVLTLDGRVLTGLVAENNEQRVVLKTQGGKIETISRDDVEEVTPSNLSLMPEGLEKQIASQELADLFAFLVLDRPPQDPSARPISGTPASLVKP